VLEVLARRTGKRGPCAGSIVADIVIGTGVAIVAGGVIREVFETSLRRAAIVSAGIPIIEGLGLTGRPAAIGCAKVAVATVQIETPRITDRVVPLTDASGADVPPSSGVTIVTGGCVLGVDDPKIEVAPVIRAGVSVVYRFPRTDNSVSFGVAAIAEVILGEGVAVGLAILRLVPTIFGAVTLLPTVGLRVHICLVASGCVVAASGKEEQSCYGHYACAHVNLPIRFC